jgi:Fur family peroxide stress response transcriptional regulator
MEKITRYSKKRDAIFEVLASTDCHPSAEWIYRTLKSDYPDLSLGTVYRNLSRFKEDGSIISVGVVDGQERYDGNAQAHPHFICKCCGAVIDLNALDEDVSLNDKAARLYGFAVDYHELVFHGTCNQCRSALNSEESAK